ncbi:MAG: BamA/TamA family outer membrane protein [Cyclobacteriaceae bacterium]|nr:BamA/TamA family outer membrane protein [Cyclobacteriaceae bacterium]
MNKHHLLVFLFFWNGIGVAQTFDKYSLYMSEKDMARIDEGRMNQLFQAKVRNNRDLGQFMHNFYEMGYLLATCRSEVVDSATCRVYISLGEPFKWAVLDQGNLPDEIFLKTGFKKDIFQDQIFNFNRITRLFKTVIGYSENHGYPFASLKLKNIEIKDNRIRAELAYDPGPHVVFSRLEISQGISMNTGFLAAFLNLRPGIPYDQRRIDNIPHRLKQLEFIRLNGKPAVNYPHDSSTISLDLEPVKANAFDGIIGFFPNENEPDKLLVTGQLFLGLENLFRSGKKLNLEWQKPNLLMQEISLGYGHPALFRSPLDLNLDFHLLKQDTTFINRDLHVNFFLNPLRIGSMGLNYTYVSSRLLSTGDFQNMPQLDQVDYDINYYGLSYRLNTLDRVFFPEHGIFIDGSIQFGNKKIIRNAGINSDSYQGLREKSFQVRASLWVDKYFKLFPRNILLTRITAGYLDNDQLFFNDLFRLGGLNSIRGFNERFFYASGYLTGTVEYRYLFENDSQLFFFFDGSGLGYDINGQRLQDRPFGFGGGFSISTRAGLLQIVYALGKSSEQPLGLNHSKIHIGYSSRF